jgi:GGDEF domain-containing protein
LTFLVYNGYEVVNMREELTEFKKKLPIELCDEYDDIVAKFEKHFYTDHLTGALNRLWLEHYIKDLEQQGYFSASYIDSDKLKELNDTLGHKVGDIYLKDLVKDLELLSQYVIRVGGDEFILISKQPIDLTDLSKKHLFSWGTGYEKELETSIEKAEQRMYEDKFKK